MTERESLPDDQQADALFIDSGKRVPEQRDAVDEGRTHAVRRGLVELLVKGLKCRWFVPGWIEVVQKASMLRGQNERSDLPGPGNERSQITRRRSP